MKDFIYAALPWIIMGLTIAALSVNFSKRNSTKNKDNVDKCNKKVLENISSFWSNTYIFFYKLFYSSFCT